MCVCLSGGGGEFKAQCGHIDRQAERERERERERGGGRGGNHRRKGSRR